MRNFHVPELSAGEIRIRVETAGICGSDLHFYRSSPEELGQRREVIIGHEPCGVVDTVGHGVKRFQAGDRAVVKHTLGCGRCEHCLSGATVLCTEMIGMAAAGHGRNAQYFTMPEEACWPLPEFFSFIACTGATAYGALRKLHPSGRDSLVVFGLGPVGLSGLLIAKALGARVIAVDILPERLTLARELGADETVNATEWSTVQAIRSRSDDRGADMVLETSGAPQAQSDALDCLAARGKAAYVGIDPEATQSISPQSFNHREVTLFGSMVLPLSLVPEFMQFMSEKDIHFDTLVTEKIPLEETPEAMARFERGAVGKYIIEPNNF